MKDFIKSRFNAIKASNLNFAGFFLCPLILLFALQIMHIFFEFGCTSFYTTGNVLFKIFISYLFLLALEAGLLVFIQKTSVVNLIMTILFFIMAFANEVMCIITGDPLLPTDFLLAGNLGDIASFVKIPVLMSHIVSFIICLCSIVLFFYLDRKKKKSGKKLNITVPTRIVLMVLGVVFCFSTLQKICIDKDFRVNTLPRNGVKVSAFNPKSDYFSNGLILTFFPRIGNNIVEAPKTYSNQKIAEIKSEYDKDEFPTLPSKVQKKPNIIIIQSEAWWDPTLIPNVTFSSDPLEKTRKIMEEGKGGLLVSPVFAGGTCLPEFEILTGFTTRLLPSGLYPHIQSVTKPVPSIASICRDNGYETFAYHPYHKHFYSRNKAYPLMGFDKYVGMEDLVEPKKSGHYISDNQMINDIISAYEKKEKDRIFIFGVSMQNHGDYKKKRYENYDIEITCDDLSDEDLSGLLDFTQGVFEADVALDNLVNYFRQVDEPTIIAMFGDHLPLLGTDGSTYQNGGFIEKEEAFNYSKYDKMFQTPYVVWANYDISECELPPEISAGNLGIKVMLMANLKDFPWYYNFLNEFYLKYPVFENVAVKNSENEELENVTDEDIPLLRKFELIEYDVLNGKQYSIK